VDPCAGHATDASQVIVFGWFMVGAQGLEPWTSTV
jgi:hypothetical protein